ncbi:MAG: SDR family NAD(P)-dependent oxidoreductase [Alphaproteobacteria bacterium]
MKVAEMFSLEGYGAVVTGGASGIGLAITEVLAEQGALVTIMDRNPETLKREVDRLLSEGYQVRGAEVDVSDPAAMRAAFAEANAARGRLDVVFANAGIESGVRSFVDRDGKTVPEGAIENYDLDAWDRVMNTNLKGVFITIQEAARHMKPRRSGRIILTSSVTAIATSPMTAMGYVTAKGGVARLLRSAAMELVHYNILVNAIAPGVITTAIGGGMLLDPAVQARSGKTIPIGRFGRPEELMGLALFLASPASSYMVGEHILVDGGLALGRIERTD